MSHSNGKGSSNEPDLVEFKKAIATGQAKEVNVSPGECVFNLLQSKNNNTSIV